MWAFIRISKDQRRYTRISKNQRLLLIKIKSSINCKIFKLDTTVNDKRTLIVQLEGKDFDIDISHQAFDTYL